MEHNNLQNKIKFNETVYLKINQHEEENTLNHVFKFSKARKLHASEIRVETYLMEGIQIACTDLLS